MAKFFSCSLDNSDLTLSTIWEAACSVVLNPAHVLAKEWPLNCPRIIGGSVIVNLRQVLLATALVSLAAATAHADGIPGDGTILVGRGSDPSPSMSCSKTDFKIKLNGHGGGITNCINTSGVDWIGLDIFAVIPTGLPSGQEVLCTSSLFTCEPLTTIKLLGNSGKKEVEITLLGGVITAGSVTDVCTGDGPADSCFFINLNDSNSMEMEASGGWFGLSGARDGTIDVHAITPEPGTLLLLLTGAGALCFRRRRISLA